MKHRNALYKVIKDDLQEKINTGYYKETELIPTELELATFYDVSRVTIRKATDMLVHEGFLKRTAGLGTIVLPNAILKKTTKHLGFCEEMKEQNIPIRTVVVNFSLKEVTAQIAQILGINKKEMVYYFERIRYVGENALQFESTYMSIKKFPDLSISYLESSKYDYIEKIKGLKIDMCIHSVIPILPSARIAELFGIQEDIPILKINNTTYLTNGEIMDYTEQYENSTKYQTKYIRIR